MLAYARSELPPRNASKKRQELVMGGIALKPGQSLLGSACICGWMSWNGKKFLTVATNP